MQVQQEPEPGEQITPPLLPLADLLFSAQPFTHTLVGLALATNAGIMSSP